MTSSGTVEDVSEPPAMPLIKKEQSINTGGLPFPAVQLFVAPCPIMAKGIISANRRRSSTILFLLTYFSHNLVAYIWLITPVDPKNLAVGKS